MRNFKLHTGLMALLQVCGFNVLGFADRMPLTQAQTFISTLGNINVFDMFVCTYLPVCIYMFCKASASKKWIYGVGTFFGFVGMLAANSDGCLLGVGVCMLLMLIIALSDAFALFQYGISVGLLVTVLILWNIIKGLFKDKMWV